MIEFKVSPSAHIQPDKSYIHPPFVIWPTRYRKPNFNSWIKEEENSACRNLIALLLFYSDERISSIAQYLGISSSRTATLIRKTKQKLFGKTYISSDEELKTNLRLLAISNISLTYLHEKINETKSNRYEITAIFFALDYFTQSGNNMRLFHNTIEYLQSKNKMKDLSSYNNA